MVETAVGMAVEVVVEMVVETMETVARGRALERMQQDPDMMHEIGLPSGHPPESTADKQACPFARLNVVSQSHRSNTHTKCLIDAVGGVAALKRSTTRLPEGFR